MEHLAKALVVFGIVIAAVGFILLFLPKIPFLGGYLGRLPGDIYIKRDNFTFYFPVTTSILISIILSLILYIFKR